MRVVAGIEQVSDLAAERPVDMLTGAIDTGERLFVQQAGHAVFGGDALQLLHDDMLMIMPQIGVFVDRGDLELAGRDLVMAGLDRDALLVELVFRLHHKGQHALRDRAEIVILKLLAFGRLRAEQRSSGIEQVRAGKEEIAVDQEILLLGAGGGSHHAGIVMAEQLQNALRLNVERLHGAQQRSLMVQRLAGPGDKRRRNAQGIAVGILVNIGRAGHVPGRVATRLKGGADAARGETGRVRLGLDQRIAGKLRDCPARAVGVKKAVMLLRREAGQRKKDVGEMRRAFVQRPGFHG